MMLSASSLPGDEAAPAVYTRLWLHEALRVFHDRLVDSTDRAWLLTQLTGITVEHFGTSLDALLANRCEPGEAAVSEETLRRCLFGDYVNKCAAAPDERAYKEILDLGSAITAVEDALADHNATSKRPMPLAVFLYGVEHISRISRVLRQTGGHMLLVGVGGSGRQSLARLAAHIAGIDVFQVCKPSSQRNQISVCLLSDTAC